MNHFALFDANQGNWLWFGPAVGVAAAIRAFDRQSGGIRPVGSQRLGVYVGTQTQIAAIELWHRIPANGFPKEIGEPTLFDATELSLIIKEWEVFANSLVRKLKQASTRTEER